MSQSAIDTQTIRFSITLTRVRLPQPDRNTLKELVTRSAQTLIKDLGIPAEVGWWLRVLEADSGASRLRVSIDGKKCRAPLALSIGDDGIEGLASKITAVIHQNRDLLINDAITRLIRETYIHEANEGLRNLKYREFHQLVVTLARRGYSLHRLRGPGPGSDTRGWTHRHYFDSLIESADTPTVRVTSGPDYRGLIEQSTPEVVHEMFSSMQEDLFDDLGIAFPRVVWEGVNEGLGADLFQIRLNDVNYPSALGPLGGEVLVRAAVDWLKEELSIEGRPLVFPGKQEEYAIVDAAHADLCEQFGCTTWEPLEFLVLYLSQQLRQEAGSFLTKDVVENHLLTLRQAYPALVRAFLDRYDLFQLTWILRDLLDEELSIRDLRSILVNLLLIQGTIRQDLVKDVVVYPAGTYLVPTNRATLSDLRSADYADYLRTTALKRHISYKYARGGSSLKVYLLAPELEERIRAPKGKRDLEALHKETVEAVYREVHHLPPTAQTPVILTTMDVRRPFRELIKVEYPQLAVLSHQEVSPPLSIEVIAEINT